MSSEAERIDDALVKARYVEEIERLRLLNKKLVHAVRLGLISVEAMIAVSKISGTIPENATILRDRMLEVIAEAEWENKNKEEGPCQGA